LFVVDTSAIIAVVLLEPDGPDLFHAMSGHRIAVSALSVLEAETVVRGRRGQDAVAEVRALLSHHGAQIVPFDDRQAQLASLAYDRFGKGQHRARLNICDCAAYALAKSMDAPLLYKGSDFARTDIASAVTAG